MIDRETMHHALQDIADYFRECRRNAASGSAASVRFDVYVSAALEADNLLKEQHRIIEKYRKADGFLAAHGWRWGECD